MSSRIAVGAGVVGLVLLAVWAAAPRSLPLASTPAAGDRASPPPDDVVNNPPGVARRAPDLPPTTGGDSELRARVDACSIMQRQVAQRRVMRQGPAAPGEPSDAAMIARACAPLYREAECRQAQLDFDKPDSAARMPTMLTACAHAYCPSLPSPKPSACDHLPEDGLPTFQAWTELRTAILRRDIGPAETARAFR